MKVNWVYTELLADGTTGKIQLGVAEGCIDQVIVPAFFVPPEAASGTDPIPPGTVTLPALVLPPLPLLEPLLLQAASAVMLATARATPATLVLLRYFIIGPPSVRSRLRSVLGSSACRPSLAGCRCFKKNSRGALGRS